MVRFLSVFALIFSLSAHAVAPSGVPARTISPTTSVPLGMGSVAIPDVNATVGGMFSLFGGSLQAAITASNVTPFYRDGDLYQVPALTSAYCTGVYTGDTNNTYFGLMSGTATFAHNTAVGSVTGIKYQWGVTNGGGFRTLTADINIYKPMQGFYRFKAGTWPGIQVQSATGVVVILDCYEKLD